MLTYQYDKRFVTNHAAEMARERSVAMEEIVAVVQNRLVTKSRSEGQHRELYWALVNDRPVLVVVGTNPKYPTQVVSVYPATSKAKRAEWAALCRQHPAKTQPLYV